jgi:hypothetical protein
MHSGSLQLRSATVTVAASNVAVANVKDDPAFPKPRYMGRLQIFSVAELNAYDRLLISKKIEAVQS